MSAPSSVPSRAMVLAAGLGTRMRPLTDKKPKAMVEVSGRALIDRVLDRLEKSGVENVIVNVHHHADLLEKHLTARKAPKITISDERSALLDSGGGVKKALPFLGKEPFFVLNADTIWIESVRPNLPALGWAFDPARMDMLLLIAATSGSLGYDGKGDFDADSEGRLTRRTEGRITPFVYAGAAVMSPDIFAKTPDGKFSLNLLFDRAIDSGRLYGLRLDGLWMHVGTPEAVTEADTAYARSTA
ncbi:mannose-1-phosphate guanylyltransferase [Terrihabitans soli]|uniref:Mannose-1-phosphate guanylyltransferase n=1 Tax=Terrihabitans soli TaxID=708113 RepID=A0A6S6QR98_9HYPH|nr:nucleotidyltransferase family protein [Terrihabitans soli]BCJ92116.1 mannose-1-phosphate guanylyltransferase [Terrihabitans soli]